MAEDSTTAPAPIDAEALQRAIAALQPPTQVPVPTEGGPATHGVAGFLSDVGTALSGGQTGLLGLSPDEQASAGRHALLRFGIDMLAASGKSYAPKDFGSVLAAGLGGAQQAQQESENRAYVGRGASQALAQQAFQNRLAAIKEAIPLLQLQQRAGQPNPFAATTPGSGAPNTSITAAASVPAYGGAVNAPQMPAEYEPYFQEASKETGIPVEVLKAQAAQESGFNPNAKGAAGEVGLFQIKPDTARKPGFGMEGVSDPAVLRDPRSNILFGARYLKARAGNADLTTPAGQAAALQAYNGGGDKNYVANVFRYMPPGGGGGGGGTQVAAAKPPAAITSPPAAPAAATPPGRVQVATADTGTKTDATPASAPPPAYATAPTREAATLQAAATKQPVMIQGGDGGTVMPDGSFRSAPPPATTAPPVVPGQPRDITGLKDEDLSLPEFQQRYRTPLAPDAGAVKVNPQVQADRQAAVAAAQKSVTQAQAGMRAAEQDWTVQRDDKSLQARSAAQQRLETAQQNLQTAQQNANKLQQDAETETVKNRQAAQTEQDKQLAAAYKDARDRANQAAEAERNRQNAIALKEIEGKNQQASNAQQAQIDSNKTITTEVDKDWLAARNGSNDLDMMRQLNANLQVPATGLGNITVGGRTALDWLAASGLGTEAKQKQWGAAQTLQAALEGAIKNLRAGALTGSTSDTDLRFLQNMGPRMMEDPATREAVINYLDQAQQAKKKFAIEYHAALSSTNDAAKALKTADAAVGDIVPGVPKELAGQPDEVVNKWFADHMRPNSFFRRPDGKMSVYRDPNLPPLTR